jgi:hypothetical protein
MQNIMRDALAADPWARLARTDCFVGWVYSIDYESALVMIKSSGRRMLAACRRTASLPPHSSWLRPPARPPKTTEPLYCFGSLG